MKIYGDARSGNCCKVKWICDLIQKKYEWVEKDVLAIKEKKDQDFLSLAPNGKVPIIELEDGTILSESNAILFFLAQKTAFLPDDALIQAQILQWMFFEQYSHEPYIATNRFFISILEEKEKYKDTIETNAKYGQRALSIMNEHLREEEFFVDHRCTIADIALFAYTHVAEEGGYILADYPYIVRWIEALKEKGMTPIS